MKLLFNLFLIFLLSGCSVTNIEATLQDAEGIAIDQISNKEDVKNVVSSESKSGYTIEFDVNNEHYLFIISKEGYIKEKKVEEKKAEEKKAEEKEEQKIDELSDAQKKAKKNVLINSGIKETECTSISVKNNKDGTINVTLKLKAGYILVSQTDKNGTVLSTWYE